MSRFEHEFLELVAAHQATASEALEAVHNLLQMSIEAYAKAAVSQSEAERIAELARQHFANRTALLLGSAA
jgi:hypothetical protein